MSRITNVLVATALATMVAAGGAQATHKGTPHGGGPGGGGGNTMLGDLDCTAGEIPKWDGEEWLCAADMDTTDTDWNSLTNVPADIADGDADTNAMTECLDNEVLLGSGECLAITSLAETLFAPRTIFVSSQEYDGNLGGLDGADAKCTELANSDISIVPEGDYIAVLSTSLVSAASRVGVSMGPIVASNGAPVAENVTALFSTSPSFTVEWGFDSELTLALNSLITPITYDETGAMHDFDLVWTGSRVYGDIQTPDDPAELCSNWTTDSSGKIGRGIGDLTSREVRWLNASAVGGICNSEYHLYCIHK